MEIYRGNNMPKYYTGIGSRKTPDKILREMKEIASILSGEGWTLRSGGAEGGDSAFESGAKIMEIYRIGDFPVSEDAWQLAISVHPCPEKAMKYKKIIGRNPYQLLGRDLKTPSRFIVCWTPGGAAVGGTATNILLARKYDIPVFNLFNTKKEKVISYSRCIW